MQRLLIYSLYPPYVGGAAATARLLTDHLPGEGPLWLLTQRAPGKKLVEQRSRLRILRLLPRRDGVRRKAALRPALWLATQFVLTAAILALRLRGVRLVQVHGRFINSLTTPFFSLLRATGVRVVADQRDRFTRADRLRHFDHVAVNSQGLLEFYSPALKEPERISLIPSPLDLNKLQRLRGANDQAEPGLILFVGEVSRRKGLDLLLDALTEVRRSQPATRLVVVGPATAASDPELLQRLASEAQWLGPLPRLQVWDWMCSAERVVLPSYSESLPRSLLEAVALGRPVIAPPGLLECESRIPHCVLPRLDVDTLLAFLLRPAKELAPHGWPLDDHDPTKTAAAFHALHHRLMN